MLSNTPYIKVLIIIVEPKILYSRKTKCKLTIFENLIQFEKHHNIFKLVPRLKCAYKLSLVLCAFCKSLQ